MSENQDNFSNKNDEYEYDPAVLEQIREAKIRRQRADELARDRLHAKMILFGGGIVIILAIIIFISFEGKSTSTDNTSSSSDDQTASYAAEDLTSIEENNTDSSDTAENGGDTENTNTGDYYGQAEGHTLVTENGITYVDGILIVNKTFSLPSDYDPGLDPEAEAAFYEMAGAAWEDGITLWIASGYRTYDYQDELFDRYATERGLDEADKISARPGHSEHQSGLCVDINDPSSSFNGTAEAIWLEEHCAEYGFIVRFPEGKEDITGYEYEPWHLRYVGVEIAQDITNQGLCLEEYLNVTSDYADSLENEDFIEKYAAYETSSSADTSVEYGE